MKTKKQQAIWKKTAYTAILLALVGPGKPDFASAQSLADYTSLPIFLNQTVPPNVLFLADMGNYTLEAAYSGSNHKYPISFKAGAATSFPAARTAISTSRPSRTNSRPPASRPGATSTRA